MTVYIHLVNKETIVIEHSNDVQAVWAGIEAGTPIDTNRGYDDKVIVNKANVTSVTKGR